MAGCITRHDSSASSKGSITLGPTDSTISDATAPSVANTLDAAKTDVSAACIGPYVPGSILLPQISLLPPENGTTGQIVDKILMPRHLPHLPPGHTQTVFMYDIIYPDRPGERELVPFNEIFRHVSLRELERWEDQLSQMCEEQKRQKKKARRQKAKARRQELKEQRQRERENGPTTEMVTRATRRRTGAELLDKLDAKVDLNGRW